MTDLFLLSRVQMRRIERYFPLSHGVARVDDRRIVSAIVFVIKNGLRWRDAPPNYGPHKTIYNRFVRWSRLGVFNKIFAELAGKGGKPERIMIDATHLRAIGIEQQGRHHARIERRLTKPAFVACDDLRQIQVLARQSDDELRQMVRRHIIDDRRRQELCLINCPRTKMSAHASKGIRFVPKRPRLLGHAPRATGGSFLVWT